MLRISALIAVAGILSLYSTAEELAADPINPVAADQAAAAAKENSPTAGQDEFVKKQLSGIRQELETTDSFKSVAIKQSQYGKKGASIDIECREGRTFLFFRGQKYIITLIDEDGDGALDRVSFYFRDNLRRDELILIKKDFSKPFPEGLDEEFQRLYSRMKAEDRKDSDRLNDFSPKRIFEKYIKQPIIDRLK